MSASYSQLINPKNIIINYACVCRGGGEGRVREKAIMAKMLTILNI